MFASLDRFLAAARWFLPLAIIVLPPIVVRVLYMLGWTGLSRFEKRSGVMFDRGIIKVTREQHDALPVRIARQLVRDLLAPLTLAIVSWIAITIVLGVRVESQTMILLGAGVAFGYLGLMVVTVAKTAKIDLADAFEASLVNMSGPMFGGYASAKVRLDDGRLVQTGVPWRPLATLRHDRTEFRLVFCGKPTYPRFVGFRKIR
ncbi:MAG TPA: hypothetical protein VH143_12740 [Kofleriaceae bacterium]|nr:hypothetical protein [Kofleriaceae bacterium]